MSLNRLPRVLLRLEGLAVLVAALAVSFDNEYSLLALEPGRSSTTTAFEDTHLGRV